MAAVYNRKERKKIMIYRNIIFLFVIAMVGGGIFSCSRKAKKSAEGPARDTLIMEYKALQDSLDKEWKVMIEDDDEKIALMKRLILEVSYTNSYDKQRFEELNAMVERLKAMRYDRESMRDSKLIDAYDSATFAVTDQVIDFARSHPRFKDFPLMEELINEINQKNGMIIIYRVHYDNWAKDLNAFIKKRGKKLRKFGQEVPGEPVPLFQLSS